jgi:hypothetical protein
MRIFQDFVLSCLCCIWFTCFQSLLNYFSFQSTDHEGYSRDQSCALYYYIYMFIISTCLLYLHVYNTSNEGIVLIVMVWLLDLQLSMCNQCLSPLTLRVVHDSKLCDKFVSDLWQVGGSLRILRFTSPIKLIATIWLKYCWKWR